MRDRKYNLNKSINSNKLSIIFIGMIAISMALIFVFIKNDTPKGLSCLGVRSNINNLIEMANKYKNRGITNIKKNNMLDKLDQSLADNKRLSCHYNTEAILRKFSHLSRD